MAKQQEFQGKNIISLKRELAHYVTLDLQQQSNTHMKLQHMEQQIEHTRQEVSGLLNTLITITSDLDKKTITIPLLSKLTQLRADLATLAFSQFPEVYYSDLRLLNNLRDAQRGILQHGLLDRGVLQETLTMATEQLKEWPPDYQFVTNNLNQIYMDNRVRVSVTLRGAIVQKTHPRYGS